MEKTVREIEALESDYVLKASLVELEEYYASKVRVTPLALFAEDHYIDKQEGTQIDVTPRYQVWRIWRRADYSEGHSAGHRGPLHG